MPKGVYIGNFSLSGHIGTAVTELVTVAVFERAFGREVIEGNVCSILSFFFVQFVAFLE